MRRLAPVGMLGFSEQMPTVMGCVDEGVDQVVRCVDVAEPVATFLRAIFDGRGEDA